MTFYLLSKDEETAKQYKKEKNLDKAVYFYTALQAIGEKDGVLVIFPGLKARKDTGDMIKIAINNGLKPAFSSILDIDRANQNRYPFKSSDIDKYEHFIEGLYVDNNALRWLKAFANKTKISGREVLIAKKPSKRKPIFVETSLGWVFIGDQEPDKIKFPIEFGG